MIGTKTISEDAKRVPQFQDENSPVGDTAGHRELGRGRSGIVYLIDSPSGKQIACKVFDSRGLTKIVQWLTLGAPNPYMWNYDAVQCAKYRRDILSILVPVWTAGHVTVAGAECAVWNSELKTFELHTHFMTGRCAKLHHPLRDNGASEAASLWKVVMPELRDHLQAAGFDGLLWQAGIGNPVALNNFLLEGPAESGRNDTESQCHNSWAWIDLESGVPAIFPISPNVFFQYSIGHLWRTGRIPFDDVDMGKLDDYLGSNGNHLRSALGDEKYDNVLHCTEMLRRHQHQWKSLSRIQSSIRYRQMRGYIDEEQARYYDKHQVRWVIREAGRAVPAAAVGIKRLVAFAWKQVRRIDALRAIRNGWRFLVSQRFREEFVHKYLDNRISFWTARGQMSNGHGDTLRAEIGSPDSSVYITDFGIHLALKPAVKATQYWILPTLFAFGLLSGPTVAILIVAGGAVIRTAYTAGRIVQSVARKCERPWIALVIGVLPAIGNLAYPVQMLFSISTKEEKLAKFMVDDGFASIGRHIPIWGGQDTWTEHVFNRMPVRTVEYWASRRRGSEALDQV